jgi:hypothetical protein
MITFHPSDALPAQTIPVSNPTIRPSGLRRYLNFGRTDRAKQPRSSWWVAAPREGWKQLVADQQAILSETIFGIAILGTEEKVNDCERWLTPRKKGSRI